MESEWVSRFSSSDPVGLGSDRSFDYTSVGFAHHRESQSDSSKEHLYPLSFLSVSDSCRVGRSSRYRRIGKGRGSRGGLDFQRQDGCLLKPTCRRRRRPSPPSSSTPISVFILSHYCCPLSKSNIRKGTETSRIVNHYRLDPVDGVTEVYISKHRSAKRFNSLAG